MKQLISHDRRDGYPFKQEPQKVNLTDPNQVANRTGIGDNQTH